METLLEPAILTSISLGLVDLAISVGHTVVNAFILDRPLEETLTTGRGEKKKTHYGNLGFFE